MTSLPIANVTSANVIAALVNSGIVSVLIAVVLWLLLRLTPRRALNAATRYAIWWVALAIVVALPALYLPLRIQSPVVAISGNAPATSESKDVPMSAPMMSPPMSPATTSAANAASPSAPIPTTDSATIATVAPIDNKTSDTPTQSRWSRFPIEISAPILKSIGLKWFLLGWGAISVAMLARLFAAVVVLQRRKARAFAAPAQIATSLDRWLSICGTQRRIALASSAEIATPMAAGLSKPSILIPAQLFSELDAAELDQIGLHETAHLARRDDYALILQRVVEALFALHPVVRWIARRIDLEREIACDDFVIEATGRARPYAVCLTRVVELAGGVRGSLIAAAATEEPSHLARRVEMLLDKKRHTGTRMLKGRLFAAVTVLAAIVSVVVTAPGVVAFAMPADEILAPQEPPQPPVPPRAVERLPLPLLAPPTPALSRAPFDALAPIPPEPPRAVPSAIDALAPQAPEIPVPPPPGLAPQAPEMLEPPPPALAPETPRTPRALPPYPPPSRSPSVGQAPLAPRFGADFQPPLTPPSALAFQASPTPRAQPPEAPAAPAPQGSSSYNVHSHNGDLDVDWHWRDGLNARDVRMHGRIEFTDDESDVKSIPAGGWFSYEESHGFSSRKYQAMADSSGNIKRQYLVDGRDHPFDDDARAWLRANLPEMLRESAVDAPERVRRLIKKGGPNAVLAEIAKIHGSGARRRYIEELVPVGNLNTEQFQTLLRDTRAIPSDGDKSSLLIFLARYTLKDNLRDYVFDAVSTINSSGDRRRVLMNLVREDPSRATLAAAAKSAEQIASDGDKASLLVEMAQHYRGNESMRRPFFRTVETVHSSGERARVLIAVMSDAGSDHDTLVDALHSTSGIASDGDKTRVLVHAAGYWKDDDATRRAFFEAANSVNSSGERARLLTGLATHGGLGGATWIEIVHSADRIAGDGDKARVLLTVIERPDASNEALIAAVQAAARLNSEGEKARVLLVAIERSSGKPAVRTEIRNAVRSIHSDGEYRRVMSVLERQIAI